MSAGLSSSGYSADGAVVSRRRNGPSQIGLPSSRLGRQDRNRTHRTGHARAFAGSVTGVEESKLRV